MTRQLNRAGLTLVELLVVLLILVILTTIAVQSLDGVVDQGRYDANQRTLQNVQNAILGPTNATGADGAPAVTGFIADMGRPPVAQLEDRGVLGPVLTLKELWTAPDPALLFDIKNPIGADSDSEVFVPCGWRGPYLRLPVGSTRLLDGWGTELVSPLDAASQAAAFPFPCLLDPTAVSVVAGNPIAVVRSPGQNKRGDVTAIDFNRDSQVVINPAEYLATVMGSMEVNLVVTEVLKSDGTKETDLTKIATVTNQVTAALAGGKLTAKVFGPDPITGQVGAVKHINAQVISGQASYLVPPPSSTSVLTAGPRVLRLYYTPAISDTADATITLVPIPSPIPGSIPSPPTPLSLRPGANVAPRIRLTVPVIATQKNKE